METSTPPGEIVLRLVAAAVLGGLVGWEREAHGRAAGLRTHMMVALGAAVFTLIAVEWFASEPDRAGPSVLDPLRVVAAVVGGIGFLGAGAIIHSRGNVRGLTTAAGMWAVAGVGVATGAGFYLIAAVATVLALVTLAVVRWLEGLVPRHEKSNGGGEESPPAA
ncbi:MAG TPA: MgtC/SapB family protein [Longimicrobiaceae bacterium]|nr:MgtC/SapB family protein [Longimicrobiaceae bacterium]